MTERAMKKQLFLAAAMAGVFVASAAAAQHRASGGDIDQNLGKMDYGVCRGTDTKCYHDWARAKTSER